MDRAGVVGGFRLPKEKPGFLVPVRLDDTAAPPLLGALIAPAIHDLSLHEAELDGGVPPVHAPVSSYERLIARGGLLDAPLDAPELRNLLVRARLSELGDARPRTSDPAWVRVVAVIHERWPAQYDVEGLTWPRLHQAVSAAAPDLDDGDRWAWTGALARELRRPGGLSTPRPFMRTCRIVCGRTGHAPVL